MRFISLIFISIFFYSQSALACDEVGMTYYELTQNAEVAYVGGIMSVAIPTLDKQDMREDLNYPNEMQKNKWVVKLQVYETLNGKQIDKIEVTLDWCDGKEAKLGKMALLYQLENKWHLMHDQFAISEAIAVLTKPAITKHHAVVNQVSP